MSDEELTQAMTDAVIFGTGVMQDGKRIDPQSFFVDPAALTEQLEAARADAKEAEAYADELAGDQVDLCRQLITAEDKLAKAVDALQAFKTFDDMPTKYKRPDVFEVSVRRKLLAALAEIEGEKT